MNWQLTVVLGGAFSSLLCGSPLSAQVAEGTPSDRAVFALVRSIVLDSLNAGGHRVGQVVVADDSASGALLRAAAVPATQPTALPAVVVCPGSTDSDNTAWADPVGFRMKASLLPIAGRQRYRLVLSKSCLFHYRGTVRSRGFREDAAWEIGRVDGEWRIVRSARLGIS